MRSLVCLGLLLVCGCAPEEKRKWLTTFFDGVPPEHSAAVGTGSQKVVDPLTAAMKLPPEAPVFSHVPYEKRQCDTCHESKYSQKLRGEPGKLCLVCHEKILAEARFKHAPAASGDCTTCHYPHQSSRKFLLTQSDQRLCLDCHDANDMTKVADHKNVGKAACQQCHDPHKGNNRFFLRVAAAAAQAAPNPPSPK